MAVPPFVPTDFEPPTTLGGDYFRLEPLGPQHNEADHAAWTSSIAHLRSTPGFPDGDWPPSEGMSLDRNRDDLRLTQRTSTLALGSRSPSSTRSRAT